MRTTIIIALLIVFASANHTNATTSQEVTDASSRAAATHTLVEKHNGRLNVRWDSKRDAPASIRGRMESLGTGSAREIAELALGEIGDSFGLSDENMSTVYVGRRLSGSGATFHWSQSYKGIPVVNSGLMVAVTRSRALGDEIELAPGFFGNLTEPIGPFQARRSDWYVYFISGAWHPDIELSINPVLSLADIEAAISSSYEIEEPPILGVAAIVDARENDPQYRLVYTSTIRLLDGKKRTVTLDANTGQNYGLESVNDAGQKIKSSGSNNLPLFGKEGEGEGEPEPDYSCWNSERTDLTYPQIFVYNTNPYSSTSTWQTAVSSTGTLKLDNPFLQVVRGDGQPVVTNSFLSAAGTAAFSEQMVFAHMEAFRQDLHWWGLPCGTIPGKWTATVAHTAELAFTDFGGHEFEFGPNQGYQDPTYEAAVIVHEFTHSMTGAYSSGLLAPGLFDEISQYDAALGEAYSDLMGLIWRFRNGSYSTVIGQWTDALPAAPHFWRDMNPPGGGFASYDDMVTPPVDDFDAWQPAGTIYDHSLVFSQTVYDLMHTPPFNSTYMMEAMLIHALQVLPFPARPDFLMARDALMTVADEGMSWYNAQVGSWGFVIPCPSGPCSHIIDLVFEQHEFPPSNYVPAPKGFNFSGTAMSEAEGSSEATVPTSITLSSYPNPFNPATQISFEIPGRAHVVLSVFDVLGRRIETLLDETIDGGIHNLSWDGSELPSGNYYLRIVADGKSKVNPFILLK